MELLAEDTRKTKQDRLYAQLPIQDVILFPRN